MYYTIRISKDSEIAIDQHEKINLDLKYLQKSVNGHIQIVTCHSMFRSRLGHVLIVLDEEGLLKDDPVINPIASILYGSTIVGDVVLTTEYNPDPYAEPDCYAFDEPTKNNVYKILCNVIKLLGGGKNQIFN